MSKGFILRVPTGKPLPDNLQHILNVGLPELPDYVLETYGEKPDTQGSFERRITSLHSAFQFLLNTYPPSSQSTFVTKETLTQYVNETLVASKKAKGSADDLHKELEKFTAILLETIRAVWQRTDKESIALLNEAEQYDLMGKGRPDLATLIPMQLGNDIEYVLQLDRSLPPYSEEILRELHQLKTDNYPKTPSWFINLPEFQQAYFCNLELDSIGAKEVLQDFNDFLGAWTKIKRKYYSIGADLKKIDKELLPLPSWFEELSIHQQEMIKLLAANPASIDEKLIQFKTFLIEESAKSERSKSDYISTLAQVRRLPQWYWVLPEHQQYFLESVLKSHPKIEDAVSFLSSRHRTLPMPANFAAHSLWVITSKGDMRQLMDERYRSSHVASRDALDWPQAVQKRHADSNLEQVMRRVKSHQKRLIQTLISPIHGVEYVPSIFTDWLPDLPPDLELYNHARAAVKRRKDALSFLQNNHPLNIAKVLYYTKKNDPDSLALLDAAAKYVKSAPSLQGLLNQYQHVLSSPPRIVDTGLAAVLDYAGRELFLSSLEQIIILTIGGYSYGSCVSGKDRKAIELIHTDAMLMYKEKYGCWPLFDEPEGSINRVNFVSMVADVYMSWHQHVHAGQNAPGSEGIKTPSVYLPKDISKEINLRMGSLRGLDDDDRQATDNEVKNIFYPKKAGDYLLPENHVLSRLISIQLGEKNCTRIYDALYLLINQKSQFTPSESSTRWAASFFIDNKDSEGIRAIRELMSDRLSGDNNVQRLEKILCIVADRPDRDSSRSEATNSVYKCLRDLIRPNGTNTNLEQLVANAEEEWGLLFKKSKESHPMEYSS